MKGTLPLLLGAALLILDSRCAVESVQDALSLCLDVLIPGLFPMLVLSAMLLPGLSSLSPAPLCRLLGFPAGSGGVWILGCAGGFPVGAACISQAVRAGDLERADGGRMLGLCSLCGPGFLFGVLGPVFGLGRAAALFFIQMETALLLSALWPGRSRGRFLPGAKAVSMPEAMRRAIGSMALVCGWVILAAVAAGFLRRWIFPLCPEVITIFASGLLELTTGIFAMEKPGFVMASVFVCFGGVSVLLQISSLAASAGIPMGVCIRQKAAHAALGGVLAAAYQQFGWGVLLLIPVALFVKIAVAFPEKMVYNGPERKGSKCCFAKRSSSRASTAGTAPSSMRI